MEIIMFILFLQDEEMLHFGISVESANNKKKQTKIVPFSFEERNRMLLEKREQTVKKLQEEQKKVKLGFHARPVPIATKTPLNRNVLKTIAANSVPKISKTKVIRNLSFEDRNKELLRRKEEKLKQIMKEEKKSNVFHAHPAPVFKPVLVKGTSKENLIKTKIKPPAPLMKPSVLPFVAPKKFVASKPKNMVNQENKAPIAQRIVEPKLKKTSVELNTDKRAKQRKDFDDKIKQKELEEEEYRKKEEEFKLLKEKNEILQIRKMTEVKANPMPIYKPMQILKSKKPLTEAQSPAWTRKNP